MTNDRTGNPVIRSVLYLIIKENEITYIIYRIDPCADGDEEYQKLSVALEQEPPVSVRLNSKFTDSLSCSSISGRIPWAAGGYYLNQRLTFTFDPLFHAGCYYVQEASSMFVEQVLRRYVTAPVKMLDLCAAPGEVYSCLQPVAGREPVSGQRGHP